MAARRHWLAPLILGGTGGLITGLVAVWIMQRKFDAAATELEMALAEGGIELRSRLTSGGSTLERRLAEASATLRAEFDRKAREMEARLRIAVNDQVGRTMATYTSALLEIQRRLGM